MNFGGSLHKPRIAVIGAGMAGLAAAIDLASGGFEVLLLERAAAPGGKMREVRVGEARMDAGPTVFTLRRVFDELFAAAGDDFDRRIKLIPATVLARHAWNADEHLDLFADMERSLAAIGAFAGAGQARAYARFAAQAQRVYRTLEKSFIAASRPSPVELVRRIGLSALPDLWNIKPFVTLWQALGEYFEDPRLRQLFGRYATYCGSSPFIAPATLMLVAHVEQAGVWYVDGGMHRLVEQMAALAGRVGARLQCATEVRRIHLAGGRVSAVETGDGERIAVDAVVCNADNNALAAGLFGQGASRAVRATPVQARSLSAVTWNLLARIEGFELEHHSVFFGPDYRAEFTDIFNRQRLPGAPTIYVCAQDRKDAPRRAGELERLFCLVNAPPTGDVHEFEPREMEACERRVFDLLANFGLRVQRQGEALVTNPSDFNRLFPATGGALYGPASHGWRASFTRAGSRSTIPGLYLAGGSTHPGPGVPMAATSGRLAAACIMRDYASIARSRRVAMSGGTSMR
jgi:1-hydroxycarotenoid 3,4-desaturase